LSCDFRWTLETFHRSPCVLTHERWILGEALIAAAPANVLRHGERRRERPVDARGRNRLGGRSADAAYQLRIVRGTETNVVRIDDCADDIGVSVHSVDAEHQRDRDAAWAGRQRG